MSNNNEIRSIAKPVSRKLTLRVWAVDVPAFIFLKISPINHRLFTFNRLQVNNLIEDIQLHPKSWFDYLVRMDKNRLPRLAFQYELQGLRDAGRSKNTWKFQEHLKL
jgi:hypothetical protein